VILRRLVVVIVGTAASLGVGSVAHAQEDEAATPTTLEVQTTQVTEETTDTRITVESEELTTEDDDGDNTGLWGLLGLIGLLGLAGLGGRKRRDPAAVGTPPLGPAAPRTAEGATGGRSHDR